jgi:hypothetical protein
MRADRDTTCCDDGRASGFAKDVPGSRLRRAFGMPLPVAELEIWDENNKPVPPGEIVAKTDGRMRIVDG